MTVGGGGLLLLRGSSSCVDHLLHWSRAMLALLWLALWPCWVKKMAVTSELEAVWVAAETAIDMRNYRQI